MSAPCQLMSTAEEIQCLCSVYACSVTTQPSLFLSLFVPLPSWPPVPCHGSNPLVISVASWRRPVCSLGGQDRPRDLYPPPSMNASSVHNQEANSGFLHARVTPDQIDDGALHRTVRPVLLLGPIGRLPPSLPRMRACNSARPHSFIHSCMHAKSFY